MKKIFLFLSVIFSAFLISCNSGNTAESSNESFDEESYAKERLSAKDDSEKIIGIWSFGRKKTWVEFRTNGTYDHGKGEEIREDNQKYELDEDGRIVKLTTQKGEIEFFYRFEKDAMVLKPLKKKGKEIKCTPIPEHP